MKAKLIIEAECNVDDIENIREEVEQLAGYCAIQKAYILVPAETRIDIQP